MESSNDETTLLRQACDTDLNWTWSDANKKRWEVVTEGWQQFYDRWRDSHASSKFPNTFPKILELGVDPDGESLLPFHPDDTSGGRILVTKSYEDMYHRLLRLRQRDKGATKGVVITGQPGIGKTTFLKFMLARLFSAGQVVLLCDSSFTYLFYRSKVYRRPTSDGFEDLPRRRKMYCPVWALIDVDFRDQGPPITASSNIWPIQASSPNPVRWKSWLKQFDAALLGMPLWNREELMQGLPLLPSYDDFRGRLEKSLSSLDKPTLPPTDDEEIDAVLDVLRNRRKRKEDEEMADRAGRSQAPVDKVENALEILVRNATEEFGFAPRDVYRGVLTLPRMRKTHAAAVKQFGYDELQKLIRTFPTERGLTSKFANAVVVVYPCPSTSLVNLDDWAIDFKSIRIAKEAVEWLQLQGVERLRDMYNLFHDISEGSALAGWVFEAIVHRMFSAGWGSGPAPQPILMDSNHRVPPVFSTDPPSSTSNASLPSFAPLGASTRAVTQVDFASSQLSGVMLEPNTYYIPTATNNPLFDSFTINRIPQVAVVISILQITTSATHTGSGKGYPHIRKIMSRVHELLREEGSDARVEVAYCLVCPDDGSRHKWEMPAGWDESIKINDHRGDCFCIRIPVPGHVYSPQISRPS